MSDLNDPQPPPKPGGKAVWESVIWDCAWALPRKSEWARDVGAALVADMRARDAAGRAKYGTPLQTHNGRDALVDAYQEALDLTVYLAQVLGEDADPPNSMREAYQTALGLAYDLRASLLGRDGR